MAARSKIAVTRLLGLRVRIPPDAWWISLSFSVMCCEVEVSATGLITRPKSLMECLSVIVKSRHSGSPEPLELSSLKIITSERKRWKLYYTCIVNTHIKLYYTCIVNTHIEVFVAFILNYL